MKIFKYIKLLFIIASALLIICCSTTKVCVLEKTIHLEDTAKSYGKGNVKYINGIPILTVKGTNYEMGYQYGYLMKDRLTKLNTIIQNIKNIGINNQGFFARMFAGFYLEGTIDKFMKRIPPHYAEEFKGMADGSGIPLKEIQFLAMAGGFKIGSIGCSAILAKTQNGILHGRNFDWPNFVADHSLVVHYIPDGKNSFYTIGVVGYPGVFSGFSDKKIALTVNDIEGEPTAGFMPCLYKFREILENKSSLAEIEAELKDFRGDGSYNLTVSSAEEKDGAVFSLTKDGNPKSILDKDGYLYAVNRSLAHKVSSFYWNYDYNNHYREQKFKKHIATKPQSADNVLDIMADNDFLGHKDILTGFETINLQSTTHTMVFDLGNNALYFNFAEGYAPSGNIIKYDILKDEAVQYRQATDFFNSKIVEENRNRYRQNFYQNFMPRSGELELDTLNDDKLGVMQSFYNGLHEKSSEKYFNNAIKSAETVMTDIPEYGMSYLTTGRVYLLKKDYQKSEQQLLLALSKDLAPHEKRLSIIYLCEIYKALNDKEKLQTRFTELKAIYKEYEDKVVLNPTQIGFVKEIDDYLNGNTNK